MDIYVFAIVLSNLLLDFVIGLSNYTSFVVQFAL